MLSSPVVLYLLPPIDMVVHFLLRCCRCSTTILFIFVIVNVAAVDMTAAPTTDANDDEVIVNYVDEYDFKTTPDASLFVGF